MRLWRTITNVVLAMSIGSLLALGLVAMVIAVDDYVWAQAPQQPPAMTPESQIESLQQQNIDLRKQTGTLISNMAACEEYALKVKKELAAATAKAAAEGKAAQAVKPAVPDVGKK